MSKEIFVKILYRTFMQYSQNLEVVQMSVNEKTGKQTSIFMQWNATQQYDVMTY